MPTFTQNRYSVLAATITADMTLASLRSLLMTQRPDHATLTGGWAGTDDVGSNINGRNVAPPQSDPDILPKDGDYPERLGARYYFFRQTTQLKSAFPNGTIQEQSIVDAFDMIVSPIPQRPLAFQALFTSRTPGALGPALKSLTALVKTIDEKNTITVDGASLAFDPDMFLWLLVRSRDDKQLDGATAIQDVVAVNGRDNSRRNTFISDGVDFNRPAFLVAVAEVEQLGPVRVELRDTDLEAKLTADIWSAGVFSVYKGATTYSNHPDDGATRLRSAQDVAYTLLPKLIRIHQADADWAQHKRSDEILAAATSLIERYRQKYPALGNGVQPATPAP